METHFPYVIIGAGPAGVQLSYFLGKAGLNHILVERSDRASDFFRTYPRHRKLLSINKVHTGIKDSETNLRWDWNSLLSDDYEPLLKERTAKYFPDAASFVDYLGDFVTRHDIEIATEFDVEGIDRNPASRRFEVRARDGRVLTADRLILATGLSLPWVPDIEGIEHAEHYASVSVDPGDFVNKRVLIIGKGNSAFETAENLIETAASIHLVSPSPVRFAWQTHFVGNLRAVNNNFLDTYLLKTQNAVLDATIARIEKVGDEFAVTFGYTHAHGEVETLRYDRIIACTGFRFDASSFSDRLRPELTPCGRLPKMTHEWESTSISDLFFAGTLMQYRDYKKCMSSFVHGFRYNVRALTHMLRGRYHGEAWPTTNVDPSVSSIRSAILGRVNRSSGIWLQPGFLADFIHVDLSAAGATYYSEIPFDYAREVLTTRGSWISSSLEYGRDHSFNPFSHERVHRSDVAHATSSAFLHPVVRYFVDGEQVAEHHIIEDLAGVWEEAEHIEPLESFLRQCLLVNTCAAE